MIRINAQAFDFKTLNEAIREADDSCMIDGCMGQRFIASGMGKKTIEINGIPGNALGAYLSGAEIIVNGNAQDAVGDTMNNGRIVVRGSIGDAAGYAMRGGEIYVKGNAGYRAGIHMKAYKEKKPVIIIGGRTGSFLGEYQAGGLIIVLGIHADGKPIVGNFPCTGMHGGKLILRGDVSSIHFPHQTTLCTASEEDMTEASLYIRHFCELFGYDAEKLLSDTYTVVTPDSKNPYKQMYVAN